MADKLLFSRLNKQNYLTWKIRMGMFLKSEELWNVVSKDPLAAMAAAAQKEAWQKSDEKALSKILNFVDDGQLHQVKDAESAKEAWESVKNFHEQKTTTSRVSLLRRICSLNMADGADMEEHLCALEELFDRLSLAGLTLESELQVAMVYRSLPESYSVFITAMESRPDADQTIELVKQKLLDEHHRRVERSGGADREKAMKMRGKRQSTEKKEKVCFHCRKPGHF